MFIDFVLKYTKQNICGMLIYTLYIYKSILMRYAVQYEVRNDFENSTIQVDLDVYYVDSIIKMNKNFFYFVQGRHNLRLETIKIS